MPDGGYLRYLIFSLLPGANSPRRYPLEFYLDIIGNPIFKLIKTGPKHVMIIFVPLTLGTLNFRHLTCNTAVLS